MSPKSPFNFLHLMRNLTLTGHGFKKMELMQITAAFFFVTLGSVAVGSAFEGYLFAKMKYWERVIVALSGIAVFTPIFITRSLGLVVLASFIFSQILRSRKGKL